MRFFILLIFFISQAYAIDAVITVLEAPIFKEKDIHSNVVQYKRKGDIIKVDPSLLNTEAPGADINDEFIATWDRQGNISYILSKHIYIYLENPKELEQKKASYDDTDYRLVEPLPKDYPFIRKGGLRAQMTLGVSLPYQANYPYSNDIKAKGYSNPIDVNLTFSKRAPDHKDDRFYLGGTFNLRTFENEFLLFDNRSASEKGFRMGIGPFASYDAYKGEKDRIALYGSINFNFFNQLSINQSDQNLGSEERIYRAINLSPKIGIQYHRKNIYEGLDFVMGTALEYESPANFSAQKSAKIPELWRKGGSDRFTTSSNYTLSGYLGLQSTY
ncbi:MAG: hypothetical protein AB7I27_05905 [Bacteriovoracaceae bacterium]